MRATPSSDQQYDLGWQAVGCPFRVEAFLAGIVATRKKVSAYVTFECTWETCLDCARRAAARRLDDVTLPDQDPLASPQYLQRSVQQQKAARSALIAHL